MTVCGLQRHARVAVATWLALAGLACTAGDDVGAHGDVEETGTDAGDVHAGASGDGGRDASTSEPSEPTQPAALPSAGCELTGSRAYAPGTTLGSLEHAGATRSFRVRVPPNATGSEARPLVLLFHGGGGSARQLQQASSRFDTVADRKRVIAVYPDGTGALKTWNGEGCCGSAAANDIDDVGFVRALLDHLEASLCIDQRRIYATGMSNGAILSHRLGCELTDRIAAIAPVAGTNMASACAPARPLAVLQIHGTADGHVPWDGGFGCGPANVAFTSVQKTLADWRERNACAARTEIDASGPFGAAKGEVSCEVARNCSAGADVALCSVRDGGHNWPGGEPPAGLVACPGNGGQSTWSASEAVWHFFAAHARP
jgi:polyhydroxybutyrate depolymerase